MTDQNIIPIHSVESDIQNPFPDFRNFEENEQNNRKYFPNVDESIVRVCVYLNYGNDPTFRDCFISKKQLKHLVKLKQSGRSLSTICCINRDMKCTLCKIGIFQVTRLECRCLTEEGFQREQEIEPCNRIYPMLPKDDSTPYKKININIKITNHRGFSYQEICRVRLKDFSYLKKCKEESKELNGNCGGDCGYDLCDMCAFGNFHIQKISKTNKEITDDNSINVKNIIPCDKIFPCVNSKYHGNYKLY